MESWIHVNPSGGTGNAAVEIIADENDNVDKRTGTVNGVASNGGGTQMVIVQDTSVVSVANPILKLSGGTTAYVYFDDNVTDASKTGTARYVKVELPQVSSPLSSSPLFLPLIGEQGERLSFCELPSSYMGLISTFRNISTLSGFTAYMLSQTGRDRLDITETAAVYESTGARDYLWYSPLVLYENEYTEGETYGENVPDTGDVWMYVDRFTINATEYFRWKKYEYGKDAGGIIPVARKYICSACGNVVISQSAPTVCAVCKGKNTYVAACAPLYMLTLTRTFSTGQRYKPDGFMTEDYTGSAIPYDEDNTKGVYIVGTNYSYRLKRES